MSLEHFLLSRHPSHVDVMNENPLSQPTLNLSTPEAHTMPLTERDGWVEVVQDHAAVRVRVHYIIVMIRWTGLAPWEFGITFSR